MFIYFATPNNTVRAMIYLITNEIKFGDYGMKLM